MATHDYVIDNSTGANVRSDINNVLQAILTNNSSSSAPSTTAAYMWWADTTNGVLKIRNSANDGWVELLQLDGTLTLEDGSASTPALAFRDDLDTGIFSDNANHFQIATAGVERVEFQTTEVVFNDGGNNIDFRIEGENDANLFKLDAGNDKITIGGSSPSAKLAVLSDTAFTAFASAVPNSTDCMLAVSNNPSSEAANRHATIQFGVNGGTHNRVASISAVAESASNRKLALAFCTDSSSNRNERMRLTGDGELAIGTTTIPTGFKLIVNGDLSLGEQGGSDNSFIDQKQNGMLEIINSGRDDNAAAIRINRMNNISGDTTYFRDVNIYDGKGTTVMYVDGSAASVGIGTTSPRAKAEIFDTSVSSAFSATDLTTWRVFQVRNNIESNTGTAAGIAFGGDGASDTETAGICGISTNSTGGVMDLAFLTATGNASTERMRILATGHFLFNCTSFPSSSVPGIGFEKNGNTGVIFHSNGSSTSAINVGEFLNGNGVVGRITTNGSNCSFTDVSDYRLKENEVAISDGITRLKQLKPYRFNYKTDSSQTFDGFFAHEAQAVVPESVVGEKDATKKDGSIDPQCIDQSKLVPLLVAAVKELITKVETLEAA